MLLCRIELFAQAFGESWGGTPREQGKKLSHLQDLKICKLLFKSRWTKVLSTPRRTTGLLNLRIYATGAKLGWSTQGFTLGQKTIWTISGPVLGILPGVLLGLYQCCSQLRLHGCLKGKSIISNVLFLVCKLENETSFKTFMKDIRLFMSF